jgi:hypothetical protein
MRNFGAGLTSLLCWGCEPAHRYCAETEERRQRCRQARYEKYLAVVELGPQGHTQLAIAEKFGIGAETVARWLRAPEFPERRIRSDRKRDRARFLQDQEWGLHPAMARTHFSAGRIAALLLKPSRGMPAVRTDTETACCASVPAPIECANLPCSFVRCCAGGARAGWRKCEARIPAIHGEDEFTTLSALSIFSPIKGAFITCEPRE